MSKTGCFEGGFKIQGKQKEQKERKKHKPVELLVFGGVREHNLSELCMIHFPILLQYTISKNCRHLSSALGLFPQRYLW
jgi:hypothetical protein